MRVEKRPGIGALGVRLDPGRQLARPKVNKPTQSRRGAASRAGTSGMPREAAVKFISPLIRGKANPCGDTQLSWRI